MVAVAAEPFILLVVGFLLTSVAGGALASVFQRRAWRHQHDVQRRDHLREQAMRTFEEVSSLLDQRLYRMRLVYWAAKRRCSAPATAAPLDTPLEEYREVLRVWNDNLNRVLALVDSYFGETLRRHLENALYSEYAAIGEELDEFVREVTRADTDPVRVRPIGARLDRLGHAVYRFNVVLLRSLRDGRLGDTAITELPPGHVTPRQVLRFGHHGEAVLRLQRRLAAVGTARLHLDGHFGRATEQALLEFQRAHDLRPDGAAGPETWAALNLDASSTSADTAEPAP